MASLVEQAWAALESVTDPEIPVVSLRELGILRSIEAAAASRQSRDAFGQEQSRINREQARRQADFAHFSRRHLDPPRLAG